MVKYLNIISNMIYNFKYYILCDCYKIVLLIFIYEEIVNEILQNII